MIDFAGINAAAIGNAESLLARWLPDGKRKGREWVCRNPKRADNRAGSFSVNLNSGVWADFATGESGSDLISLRAFLDDSGQGEAARVVSTELGQGRCDYQPQHEKPVEGRTAPLKAKPVQPAPDNIQHAKLGVPAFAWEYKTAGGETVSFACRFETKTGKAVLPFSWTGAKWDWRAMPEPRPLYGLPRLLKMNQAVVVVTEGEKAADATQGLFPDAVVVTWAGGCKAWGKTDWLPLRERKVIVWPDNDKPGQTVAAEIQQHLLALGALTVKLIEYPEGLAKGWDAADAVAEGWEQEDALQLFWGFPKTPQCLCPLCWREGIAAPKGGPTCKHSNFKWPEEWPDSHPDYNPVVSQ
jgi:hypothetical protein